MPPRWSLALIAVLVTIGAVLRFWQARESLWLDELHTAWCAGGSLAEVAPRASMGNQSPLYYWLEWLLVQALGASELSLRLPSLVAGSLLPAALYYLAWRWTRSNLVALVAAALVIVDPHSIFYATEARPYALIELLAVIHVAIFAELLVRPTVGLRIAFILGAALLFHLHYTAALLIAAELTYWLLLRTIDRGSSPYGIAAVMVDLLFVAAIAAPATGNLLAIAARRGNWHAFVAQQPAFEILRLLPWTAAIVFVLLDPDAFLRCTVKQDAAIPAGKNIATSELRLLLVLAWLLVPVTAAWLATETDLARIFFPRYLVASAPAAIFLAALCLRLSPWRTGRIALGLLVVAYALSSSNILAQLRHDGRVIASRRDDWRAAVDWLNPRLAQQPYPVLVRAGLIEADGLARPHDERFEDYCLLPVLSLYPLEAPRDDLVPLPYREAGRLDGAARALVLKRGGAWLLVRGSETLAVNVERRLVRSMSGVDSSRWQVAERRRFGDLHVLLVVRSAAR